MNYFGDVRFANYDGHQTQELFKLLPLRKRQGRRPSNTVYLVGKHGVQKVTELSGKNIISVAGCRAERTSFFLTDDGKLYASGEQLRSYEEKIDSETFTQVLRDVKIRQIAASNCSSRALVLTDNHLIRIGQQWEFETEKSPQPGYITSKYFETHEIKKVEVGGVGSNDVCMVLLHNGDLYSLGRNCTYSELGRPSVPYETDFGLVARGVADVFAGGWHTHYISRTRKLYGFGFNIDYRCGVGITKDSIATPEQVEDMRDQEVVMAANGCFSAILTRSGDVYTAGGGYNGGAQTYTRVQGLNDIVKISAGVYSVLALNRKGKLFKYGSVSDEANWDTVAGELSVLTDKDIVDIGVAGPYNFAVMTWE